MEKEIKTAKEGDELYLVVKEELNDTSTYSIKKGFVKETYYKKIDVTNFWDEVVDVKYIKHIQIISDNKIIDIEFNLKDDSLCELNSGITGLCKITFSEEVANNFIRNIEE